MNFKNMEALLKSLILSIAIITLCSCGRSQSTKQVQSAQSQLQQSPSEFVTPKLNFHRSVTIDSDVSTFYEGMTVNPKKTGQVLGDDAFYVMINANVFPTYEEAHLNFYSKTKVNNVFYADLANSSVSLVDITKENISSLRLKEVTEHFKDGLVWGKTNLDNPENNMLNKAYVVRTEEIQTKEDVEYKSESTYLIWFECQSKIKTVSDLAYSCSKYNLKFHYKLLDYSLNTIKN